MTSPDGCICTYHEPGDGTYTRTAHKDCKAKHFAFEAAVETAVEPHPPLCPTKISGFQFQFTNQLVMICTYRSGSVTVTSVLFSCNRPHRILIARHQSCAWQDRAERADRLGNRAACKYILRSNFKGMLWNAWRQAANNANAWREWEKLP